MVFLLPVAVTVELVGRDRVQIHIGHALLFRHLLGPKAEGLVHTHDFVVLVVSVARGERHQDGMCAEGFAVVDVLAHILTVGVDGLLHARFLDGDVERVLADAGDAGTGATAVVGAVVVVADGDDDPVALADALADVGPEAVVESTAAHASEGLVLHRYLVLVEELMLVVAPAPLSVVAVAERTVAHGGVADEEEHGVVALAARSGDDTCRHGLVQAIDRIVNDPVHVFHRPGHLGKGNRMVGQVIAEARRLVVAHVLPSHTHPVHVVVHQRRHAVVRGRIGGEDVEVGGIARVPVDDFLAPVAEEVSLQVGRGLRPVATHGVSHLMELFAVAQRQGHGLLAVPFLEIGSEMGTA